MVEEYYFKEGCYIQEWLNTEDDNSMSVARVRVLANTTTKLHRLSNTTERYVINDGRANVTVNGKTWEVGAGDVVTIKPGLTQKICNKGDTDLVFFAICTPRFKLENYQQLED